MSEQTLKPCPFCGGEAVMREWSGGLKYFRVECSNTDSCDCHGIAYDTKQKAIAAWNRREGEAK